MNVKMLVAMALTGLMVTSVAYAAPTTLLADDMTATAPDTMPAGAGADANASTQNNDMSNPGATGPAPQAPADSSTSALPSPNSPDDMSADTATGDDDY